MFSLVGLDLLQQHNGQARGMMGVHYNPHLTRSLAERGTLRRQQPEVKHEIRR